MLAGDQSWQEWQPQNNEEPRLEDISGKQSTCVICKWARQPAPSAAEDTGRAQGKGSLCPLAVDATDGSFLLVCDEPVSGNCGCKGKITSNLRSVNLQSCVF